MILVFKMSLSFNKAATLPSLLQETTLIVLSHIPSPILLCSCSKQCTNTNKSNSNRELPHLLGSESDSSTIHPCNLGHEDTKNDINSGYETSLVMNSSNGATNSMSISVIANADTANAKSGDAVNAYVYAKTAVYADANANANDDGNVSNST